MIKSQDELNTCNDGKRKSAVLISAIGEKLEKQLEIAVKALRIYANLRYDGTVTGYETIAKEALKEMAQ